MGVTIGGVYHDELADPGAGSYENAAAYNQASGATQWGQNLNTTYTPPTPGAPGSPGTPGPTGNYANLNAQSQLMQQAQQAAYQAYLNSRLQLDNDTLAFQKAQQAFNETISVAAQTGMFQGAPTQAALQYGATNFGTWGMPTQGQQTLAAQKQMADLYGQVYASGQAPTGQTTLGAQQQAYNQWLAAQQQSLAQWQAQQGAAQNYLTMMAGLRGPADWAQYQKVLGSTPQGLSDLVRAAAGQYVPGGGATTGVAPTPVSLGSFVGQATGAPAGTQAMNTLVAPNQMAPQTWNNLTPSQQQMLLGTWESQGYTQDDAKQLFQQSLPKYATGAPSAGSFKLV